MDGITHCYTSAPRSECGTPAREQNENGAGEGSRRGGAAMEDRAAVRSKGGDAISF